MGEKETDIGRAVVGFREIHRRLIALAIDFNRVVDENYEQLSSSSETRDDLNRVLVHFGAIGELLSKYTLKDE